MAFGNKLKTLRKTSRFTQDEMSAKLFMEQSTYSKYENNKIVPTEDIIRRVSEAFNVSADWLLQPDGTNVTFKKDSINNGSIGGFIQNQNYYAVPKEVMDALMQQQKTLEALLQKLLNGQG